MAKRKKTIIPPSLKPRKNTKKAIPGSAKKETTPKAKAKETEKIIAPPTPVVAKQASLAASPKPQTEKKRFTLWLQNDTYRAFKVHVAMSDGSASEYIESLIRRDLNL